MQTAIQYIHADPPLTRTGPGTTSPAREQSVLLNKPCIPVAPNADTIAFGDLSLYRTRSYASRVGVSREAIFNAVHASFRRVDISYIDLPRIHRCDRAAQPEGMACALRDLVTCGTVRYLGATNVRGWRLALLNGIAENNGWIPFACVQVEHSLIYHAGVNPGMVWRSEEPYRGRQGGGCDSKQFKRRVDCT